MGMRLVSLGSNQNVLEFDSGDGYTTNSTHILNISKLYTLKELNLWLMNFSSIKLFNKIFKKSVQTAWGPEMGVSSPARLMHPDLLSASSSWSLSFYMCQLLGLGSRIESPL